MNVRTGMGKDVMWNGRFLGMEEMWFDEWLCLEGRVLGWLGLIVVCLCDWWIFHCLTCVLTNTYPVNMWMSIHQNGVCVRDWEWWWRRYVEEDGMEGLGIGDCGDVCVLVDDESMWWLFLSKHTQWQNRSICHYNLIHPFICSVEDFISTSSLQINPFPLLSETTHTSCFKWNDDE